MRITGHHPSYVVGNLTGRQVLIVLIGGAIVAVLLALPVMGDRIYAVISASAPKVSPFILLGGVSILVIGLISRVTTLDIIGASMVGALILAYILDGY